MKFNSREEIIALTPQWKGDRMDDGRPYVPDRYLKALRNLTLEEVWKPIFVKGYESQFEGRLKTLHDDGRKLIGRAVTATYCPYRPDLDEVVKNVGRSEGRSGTYNQWVIDSLTEGDVIVVDMYDKIYKGTFLGGNLTTAIKNRTKTGGGVIWGGVRDVEQMKKIEDVQVYFRGIDPTPIRDFIMTGFNTATRIGNAICLPGDIVFGAGGGVLFIPSHLVPEVVDGAAKTQVKDLFGFEMITLNKFTTAQIDKNTWTKEMLDLLMEFIETDDRAARYRGMDWSNEYDLAINGDPTDTQSAL
ncbi:MAG: RraA family protein [Lachnospiraceae bacterium]|nr:RraA family protein [Lachnospiraceae bacterium]